MRFRLRLLRHRVLRLFAILALGPLLALGVLDYFNGRRAIERVIEAGTGEGARRAAALIRDRYAVIQSDAITLTDNAETQALFVALGTRDSGVIRAARAAADTFAQAMWTITNGSYRSIELRDSSDLLLLRLPADSQSIDNSAQSDLPRGGLPQPTVDTGQVADQVLPPITFPVFHPGQVRPLGRLVVEPRTAAVIPAQLRTLPFGSTGYLVVVDSMHRVLFDTRTGTTTAEMRGANMIFRSARVGTIGDDSARLGSAEMIPDVGWTVLSTAVVSEFTAGLERERLLALALVVLIAIGVAILFTVLVGRATRSLEELTTAAGAVGRGDFAPRLPIASDDEIGTLSSAFGHMLSRVSSMMREIEVSRQLAVLGEFSAQLSHEIRNPLTSLKLNLQGLFRDVQRGNLSMHAGPPLDTCLREVKRLDGVARDVLELARPRSTTRSDCDMHALLERTVEVHARRLEESGISVVRDFQATRFTVSGDPEQLVGLLTNLVVNAIDAQPDGGRLLICTQSNGTRLKLLVADDGPGVPAELGDRIFRPFVTAKLAGTGLGLPMALNVARDHGGSLELVHTPEGFAGATFRVTLPLP